MLRSPIRALVPLLGASLLLLATAGGALGKCAPEEQDSEHCQGVVGEIDMTGGIQAGTDETVGVWLTQGEEPVRGVHVYLVFARVADGAIVRVPAQETGLEGRYATQVRLPAGGTWTVATEVRGTDGYAINLPLTTMQVTDPPVAPPADGGAPIPAAPITFPIWLWAALAAGAAALLGGVAAMNRRRATTA